MAAGTLFNSIYANGIGAVFRPVTSALQPCAINESDGPPGGANTGPIKAPDAGIAKSDNKLLTRPVSPPSSLNLLKDPRLDDIIGNYFERLYAFSDPPSDLCVHDMIDYPTNESTFHKAFNPGPRSIVGRGGVYIGTGAGLFLPHMVHQGATSGYIVDKNRAVTEGIIPATGIMLIVAQGNPALFLSYLFSIPLTDMERQELAHASMTEMQDFFAFTPDRKSDESMFKALMSDLQHLILPHLNIDVQDAVWNMIQQFFAELYVMGADHLDVYHSDGRKILIEHFYTKNDSGQGGLLSSAETMQAATDLWTSKGKIIGVSADWRGQAFARISEGLRQSGETVRVIYPSNILEYFSGDYYDVNAQRIRSAILALPFDDESIVVNLVSGGAGMKIYTVGEYEKMIDVDTGRGESGRVSHRLIGLLADHYRMPDDLESWKYYAACPMAAHPFGQALSLALNLGEIKRLSEARVCKIARDFSLSPNDTWRLVFALREIGLIEA